MRILVTGGSGFIGRSLLARLVEDAGNMVTALAIESYAKRRLPHPLESSRDQFDLIQADLSDFQKTKRIVEEVRPDLIFHLAAAGVSDPFLPIDIALRHNLYGTLHLLRAAFEPASNIPHPKQLIIARTPGENSAMNHYAASKAAAWQLCRMYAQTSGWPIVGAMIYQAYGPGQPAQSLIPAAMNAALAGLDFPMTAGEQERDWIYVTDVLGGLLSVCEAGLAPGTTVDLGSGKLTSVADAVHRIYQLVGGKGRPLVGVLPSRPGEVTIQRADVARTKDLTGWQTAVTLNEGLSTLMDA